MIIKCATCGTHVPADIAVEVTHAGRTRQFCSARCADKAVDEPLPALPTLPRRLLVAVDGSGPSLRAVEYAAALAQPANATVQLLLVINTAALRALGMQPVQGGHVDTLAAAVEKALRDDGQAQLARCQRICEEAGVPCTTRIEVKAPLEAILEAAPAADLIVIGSRGREALDARSLGSLAQRVVTAARTPVLVVH